MISTRFLFLMMAAWLAVGILVGSCMTVSLGTAFCLLAVALLLFVSFCLLRRGGAALLALASLFVLLGLLRSLLPDVAVLPDSLVGWGISLSDMVFRLIHRAGLSAETESLLEAMLMGHRTNLSAETVTLYRQTGAAHILALSGLHLGVLFGLFNYWLMHVLHLRWRFMVGMTGLALLWGYALLTGFPVSLCRASLMMSFLVIGQMRQVGNDSWHTLGLAAFLLLLITPSSLFDVGFQLSFSAVAGMLLFYRPLSEAWMPGTVWLRGLWLMWIVSLSAQMATLPLLLHYFHRFSLSGILLSPAYILLATLIIYVALLLLLSVPLGWDVLFRSPLEALVGLQHGLMSQMSHLTFDKVEDVWLTWGQVILFYMAILCLLPSLWSLRLPHAQPSGYRRAMFFRSWPYLLAALILSVVGFSM